MTNAAPSTHRAIRVTAGDNVATAIDDIPAGASIQIGGETYVTTEPIPYGHKVALDRIEEQAVIVKYGELIGVAGKMIERGALVHVHNVVSQRGRGDLTGEDDA